MDRVVDAFSRAHAWRSSHQFLGRYSVNKLQQFDQYRRETPFWRTAATIALSIVPTIITSIILHSIETVDSNSPPSQSIGISLQSAFGHAAVGVAISLAARQALSISSAESPSSVVFLIGVITGIVSGLGRFALLEVWRSGFAPTGELVVAILGLVTFLVANYALLKGTLRRRWSKVRSFMILGATQTMIVFAFAFVSLAFQFTSSGGQIALLLVHPALRVVATKTVWLYARKLNDLTTDVTICFSEIAGTLCQTVCLLNVRGPGLSLLIVIMEISQASVDMWIYVTREYVVDGVSTLRTSIKIIEGAQAAAEEFELDEFEANTIQSKSNRDSSLSGFSLPPSSSALKYQATTSAAATPQLSQPDWHATGDIQFFRRSNNTLQDIPYSRTPMKLRRSSSDSIKKATGSPATKFRRGSMMGPTLSPRLTPTDRQAMWKSASRTRFSSSSLVLHASTVSITAVDFDTATITGTEKVSSPTPVADDTHRIEPASAVVPVNSFPRRISAHAAICSPSSSRGYKGSASSASINSTKPRARYRSSSVFLTPRLFRDLGTKRLMNLNAVPTISAVPTPITPRGYQSVRPMMATRPSQVRIDGLSVTRKDQARILEQTLQLMFSFEALIVVQFIRIIVPVMLGLIMYVMGFMPNCQTHVLLGTHTRSEAVIMASMAVGFGVLEAVPIIFVCRTIERRYGLATLRLLGFVLEHYWMSFHGKLVGVFVITFFCLSEAFGVPSMFQPGKA